MAEYELRVTDTQALAELQEMLGFSDLVEGGEWVTLAQMREAWHVSETTLRERIEARLKAGVLERGRILRPDCLGRLRPTLAYRAVRQADKSAA